MAGFDLARSPFAVLGTTPHATRAQIAAAYDEALWEKDDPGHERALDIARNELLAPATRIAAELGYFLTLDAATARALVGGSAGGEGDVAEHLGGLDRCNLLAHRCANGGGAVSTRIRRAKALLHGHDDVSFEEVDAQLAMARRKSGFGTVANDDLRAALRSLRRSHAEAIVGTLADDAPGIDAITGFIEGFAQATSERQELVDAMLGAYETRVGPRIEAGAQTVRERLVELADSEGQAHRLWRAITPEPDAVDQRQAVLDRKSVV